MKESVYRISGLSGSQKFEIELLLDINRELNQTDERNIRESLDALLAKLGEETLRLKPETKTKYEETKAELLAVFGNRMIYAKEIPNGYCDCYQCKLTSPWFEVTTAKGVIKIGWRKRVINIDWSASDVEKTAEELFSGEDVTKYDKDIHAWGLDKAREYVETILK